MAKPQIRIEPQPQTGPRTAAQIANDHRLAVERAGGRNAPELLPEVLQLALGGILLPYERPGVMPVRRAS